MARDIFPTWPFRIDAPDPANRPAITVRRVKGAEAEAGIERDEPETDHAADAESTED